MKLPRPQERMYCKEGCFFIIFSFQLITVLNRHRYYMCFLSCLKHRPRSELLLFSTPMPKRNQVSEANPCCTSTLHQLALKEWEIQS